MNQSPNEGAVVAYQPWLKGERGGNLSVIPGREANYGAQVRTRESRDSGSGAGAPSRNDEVSSGKDPVTARIQAHDLACPQFPVAGGVDLDHGFSVRQRDFSALHGTEITDMRDLALKCAGPGRAYLHVMAADEQPGSARPRIVGREGELLATKPHGAIGDVHGQLDRLTDETMHERAGRAVIDFGRRADLLDA